MELSTFWFSEIYILVQQIAYLSIGRVCHGKPVDLVWRSLSVTIHRTIRYSDHASVSPTIKNILLGRGY